MKTKLWVLIFITSFACRKKTPNPEKIDIAGRYNGTISGSFYPSDFPASKQESFTEPASFEISIENADGAITGFDSVAAKLTVDKSSPSDFSVIDIRDGSDLRVNATGRCKDDTLEMTGSYHFLDRSQRTFRFIGVRMR
ncbi:MAG: hypothetical protein BGO21_30750 [Dyadobacter sp. 50-39]|uniref:hypothetical protein n=1 Tax=Dyadobacter sp. 50-39 TaxID=1895756 RepID=UPI00096292A8|nr:hypothetical protein [Dyadobacter sp. 50-39]OJV15948.1 MAG: hypothetical protein BGO21_30750 [Dyadobacter sp. 50-39]